MALIKCRECGNEVSSEAPACPHCGIPVPAGRVRRVLRGCLLAIGYYHLVIIIIAIVAVIVSLLVAFIRG